MSEQAADVIPAAWLRTAPPGYRLPVWRWILLPATALLFKMYGGSWVNGQLQLTADSLNFIQTRTPLSRGPALNWSIKLDDITDVGFGKAMASERIIVAHAGGTATLMVLRSQDFAEKIRRALPQRQES